MTSAIHNDSASLRLPVVWSVAFHLLIFGSLIFSTIFSHRGEFWGGAGGGAVTVGLVGNLPGIPLPRPEAQPPSRVVDETKGLYKEEPRAPEPPVPETKLPEFTRNKPPRYVTRPSKVLDTPAPPPTGAIPYGQGGAPNLPYTQFTMGSSTSGGLGFSGPGGDFGGRFPWYVQAVRNRISSNWLQSTVDPGVAWAPRAVVTFQILRDGHIANIELLRSSGNASVDNSARRAILSSSPLAPLPGEYSGSYVSVEFWFEFRR